MNLVQQIERVRFWIDRTNSPRYDVNVHIIPALQSAEMAIVNDRYDNIKKMSSGQQAYSFQALQRVKDELYTIVKKTTYLAATGDYISYNQYPNDYQYILDVYARITNLDFPTPPGQLYPTEPTTYDVLKTLERDPFNRPKLKYPSRVAYIEGDQKLTFYWGDNNGALQDVFFYYLSYPTPVRYGTERNSTYIFTADTNVYAVITTVYNSITYLPGDPIFIDISVSNAITSGLVVEGCVDSELPQTIHEEVCKKAAGNLGGIVENFTKQSMLEQKAMES